MSASGGPADEAVPSTLSQLWPESALQPLPPPEIRSLAAVPVFVHDTRSRRDFAR